ncbi:MAG TPA: septation protein SepH [Kineosporiaceae bacterium]|nr:septation protein SepH [Kineosporiaceae bacterium]
MDDLSLVGVHDDGEHLLVAGPSGQRFRLRVDDALRAAVRRDRARLSQLQLESEGRLRPKEIQARIRAGETAEEVASAAGLALEHVRKYEGPVLAEREYVADQARQVRVRRGGAAGSGESLGELVAERLIQREVDLERVVWDAWRGEDGTWTVALDFEAGSSVRQARWIYNASVRHVTALDDEARWLTDEEPPAAANAAAQRRLAPVRDRVFDVDAAPAPRPVPEEPTAIDLLDTLRERRGRRNRPLSEDEEIAGAPDPVREAIDSLLSRAEGMSEPPPAHPARSRPQDARDGEVLVLPDAEPISPKSGAAAQNSSKAKVPAAQIDDEVPEPDPSDDAPVPAGAGRRPMPGANRKQRRASVPSWDDIVFGQRRD